MSKLLRRAGSVALLLCAVSAGRGGAAIARPALYWQAAPPTGARIVIGSTHRTLTVKAAATNPRERVTLSLLGSSPARLTSRSGNPAVGVITLRPRDGSTQEFSVTVAARTSGAHPIAITRTFIVQPQSTVSLVGPGAISRWAYVLQRTIARAAPTASANAVTVVPTATSDGQPNLVIALAEQRDSAGVAWVRVRLATLPNGRTGWVPREELSGYRAVTTRLLVDTSRLTLTLYKKGRVVFHAPIGIGRAAAPTPTGTFYIREKLTNFHSAFYGPIAFGTNARSAVLTDWPGGGVIGIHGTNTPALIPGRISHGCVRLRNADILRLARILPLGTPVLIR